MHQKSTILNALNDTVNQLNAFIENLNQAEFDNLMHPPNQGSLMRALLPSSNEEQQLT